MGHYRSEMADLNEDLKPFYPRGEELPPLTEENLAFNIARARKAEAELAAIRKFLGQFHHLIKECQPWG